MIEAAFGLAIHLNTLHELGLLNDTLIGDLVEDIVLHFLEDKFITLLIDNVLVTTKDNSIRRCSHVERTDIFGDVDFIRLCNKGNCHAPRSNQLSLNQGLNGCLQVHSLVKVASKQECNQLGVTQGALGRVFMWEELLSDFLVVGDEAIVEDSDTLLLVKYRVSLLVTHRVLARGVTRVKDCDSAPMRGVLRHLNLFLALLNFKFVNELIHLEEAIVLLVNDHVILQHVLVVCDSYHGHS